MNWKRVSNHLHGDANYYDLKARRAPCATERDAHTATANTLRSLGTALLAGLPTEAETEEESVWRELAERRRQWHRVPCPDVISKQP